MGIDLGTSSVKSLILDSQGQVVSLAVQEYGIDHPRPGWAEQDPHVWVNAACQTMWQAFQQSGVEGRQIAGIGIAGQMHGTVCLNVQGNPIRPAIIWADQRSQSQVERVITRIRPEKLAEWTGNPLATGFMLATWLWLLENEPLTSQQTCRLMLPKDYLRYRLTGKAGSEPSDASSTLLFDTARRTWSPQLLDALDIQPGILPEIHPSAEIAGGLTQETAALTGLLSGTPLVFGGSDQALQALGNGIVQPGTISSTIGSGGQLFAPSANPVYDPGLRLHLFCHVLPELWHLEAAILSAGLSLKWLRDSFYPSATYQSLADAATQVKPGAEGLFFLPHLIGERTPYMDPQSTAAFVGLTRRHARGHLVRAVMEGVVLSLKSGLDIMLDLGVPVDRIVASGGGTRHPLWLQLQADIFNQPIYRTQAQEAAAIGAAILAGCGVGVYKDLAQTSLSLARWSDQIIYPLAPNSRYYENRYRIFDSLYPALKLINNKETL